MKKNALIILVLLSLFAIPSCFTAKKIRKIVNYSRLAKISNDIASEQLNISFEPQDSIPGIQKNVQIEKNKDYLVIVPFLTWHKRDYDCEIGSATFEQALNNNIKESILFATDSILDGTLNKSYNLKLKVSEVHFEFNYYNKGGFIGMPPTFAFTWKNELCRQTRVFLKLDYNLSENGKTVTMGEIQREELIDTIYKYTPITSPTWDYNAVSGYSRNGTSSERQNLNGGINNLIAEEMSIGLVAFNDNIQLLAFDLVAAKLRGYLE